MAVLKTKYLGIELKNPLIVGACSLTSNMDTIKKLEDSGAGAIVIKSLFEEQIQLKSYALNEALHKYDEWHAEMVSIFPDLSDPGPEEHLMWVRKAKAASSIPVFASLNAVNRETWVDWAKKLAETGVDGLELNFFASPTDFSRSALSVENEQAEIMREVKKAVKIPVAVKLSPFYTNSLEFVKRLDSTGVEGFVLFNRPFEPSIDIEQEKSDMPFNLSTPNDHRLALRFIGLLSGKVNGSLCASNGIHTASNAVEMLLAGADAFQMVSALYRSTAATVKTVLDELSAWMDRKGYKTLADFRGKLDAENNPDKNAYRRTQYVKLLVHPESHLKR
jgi:dihydroorotate dehydrogenase (fumarate)